MKLIDWVLGREPVATATGIAAVVTAGLGLAAVFGLPITAEQIAAIGALAAALAGWAARKAVSPVHRPAAIVPPQPGEQGSIPLALIIGIALVVVLVAGFAFCTDALFEDEQERNDVGLPALVLDHDECWDEYDCGGYDERNGGYGDGRGGDGRFGGGRSGDYDGGPGDDCRNACGNTIIVPTPGERGGDQR